jgi:hypothetical protein
MRTLILGFALFLGAEAVAAAPALAPAPRQVAIYNDSDFALVQLQARAPRTKPWTFELLGKHSVGVGRPGKAAMPPGTVCIYDLLATFDDGHKQQMLAVNTCKAGTIKFSR